MLWSTLERELVPDSLTDIVNIGRGCYPSPLGQQQFEMFKIVVAEDSFLAAGSPHARNHRRVVELVGKDDTAR